MAAGSTASRSPKLPSGRFVLRIDPGLHAALRRAARESGVSLNDYCAGVLAAPAGGGSPAGSGLGKAVARAASLFGGDLVGVVAFGSWARGEAGDWSDIDLLVVVERTVGLSRRLYRAWDEAPVVISGHRVEPQFVHLPPTHRTVAGMWAEVALDGIVLFDTDLRVARRLIEVRRDIVERRIVRRTAHGQAYWIENEVA